MSMTGNVANQDLREIGEDTVDPEFRQKLLEGIERELPRAFELRRMIHQNPKISGQEFETADLLKQSVDFSMERAAESGYVGRFGPETGRAVLVRAELDALPVTERTDVSWASTNGAMHACGHDVHQAAWVAFCRAAADLALPKAIVGVLQPREEAYPSGAKDIVSEGWLEKFDVDSALAVHVHPSMPNGEIAIGTGAINAAADTVHVSFSGKSGHGAYPHLANSPVQALVAFASALPNLRQERVDPMEAGVVSIGQIHVGGAANVIPESGFVEATLRTMSTSSRERLYEEITRLAQSLAAAWGLDAEIRIEQGEPVLINDEDFALRAQSQAQTVGLEIGAGMYSCGADDFSYFSEHVESLMIFAGVDQMGKHSSLHSPYFLPTEDAVRSVAYAYAAGYLAAVNQGRTK